MKKFLAVIASMLVLTLMVSSVAFAADGTNSTVTYNGQSFETSEL